MNETIRPSPPDPKPGGPKKPKPRRIVEPLVVKAAGLADSACVACGGPGSNVHHFIPRGNGGDDVPANLGVLCGSGTVGCHGAFHGSPYVVEKERRDREWVNRRIGLYLFTSRRETLGYVLDKLGDAGVDWLRRTYYLDLEVLLPSNRIGWLA